VMVNQVFIDYSSTGVGGKWLGARGKFVLCGFIIMNRKRNK
jgi:hypothetical protein